MTRPEPPPEIADHLAGQRFLVIGTGAPAVSALPAGVLELEALTGGGPIRIALTRQSLRFLTRTTLTAVTGRKAFVDEWGTDEPLNPDHVDIAQWATVILVYPATLHFLSRLALGQCDTPVMLALQCTTAPIVLAPSLPPGGFESAAYRDHRQRLETRPHIRIAEPRAGYSMRTGADNVGAPCPFGELLPLVTALLAERGQG
ncbi:flavoprotein [Amycolatopsis panacis]|uniref:flavoprotein n=1 Tax=Amycolatopsis panacis TaxID=2340917 RepID=UPI001313E3AC|nr:flavoprotein [Amycolatopsis panacis]